MQTGKTLVQNALTRAHLYHRVRASRVYDLYWTIFDKTIIDDRRAEIAFYRHVLNGFQANSLVFDVGANHGWKTDTFLRLGARVVAVDPDEMNQDVLRQKFLTYRLFKKPLTVVGKALGESNGTEREWGDGQ